MKFQNTVFCFVFLTSLNLVIAGSGSIINCFYINGDNEAVEFVCEGHNGTYPQSNCHKLHFEDNSWATQRAKLKVLKLGNCRGSGMNEGLFKTFVNLRVFDISYFGVTYLNSEVLNLKKLEQLNASHNQMTNIQNELFSNTPIIMNIDFSYNLFTSIGGMYFKGAVKLTTINFSHNKISSLNSISFNGLGELQIVDLSSNLIETIDNNQFDNNKKLKVLRLDNNPVQAFDFLSNLMRSTGVSVSLSHISRLDTSFLVGSVQVDLDSASKNEAIFRLSQRNSKLIIAKESFEGLEYLNLSGNQIKNTAQIVDLLGSSIETLDVSSNFMEILNAHSFEKFTNLKSLNLRSTNLTAINLPFLTYNKKLESLNVEDNPIVSLNCNIFELLKSVPVQVSCDHIKEIDTSCMENALKIDLDVKIVAFRVLNDLNHYSALNCPKKSLQNVKHLNISGNELKNTAQIIDSLGSSIETLDVSLNFLHELNANIFEKFTNLKHLNLQQTQLSKILTDTMHRLPFYGIGQKLRELYMDKNPIERFDCNVFLLLMSSITAEISWENVREIDTSCMSDSLQIDLDEGANEVIFRIRNDNSELHCSKEHFQKLIHFNISGNHLKNAPKLIDLFGSALQTLDVSSNFVGKLSGKTFKKLNNLQYLNLSNTNLSNFGFSTFYHQTKLKTLDLSFNRMGKVDFTLFLRNFRALSTLNLEGNDLTEIDSVTRLNFPKLASLGISKNRFSCHYLVTFLRQWDTLQLFHNPSDQTHIDGVDCYHEDENADEDNEKNIPEIFNLETTSIDTDEMTFQEQLFEEATTAAITDTVETSETVEMPISTTTDDIELHSKKTPTTEIDDYSSSSESTETTTDDYRSNNVTETMTVSTSSNEVNENASTKQRKESVEMEPKATDKPAKEIPLSADVSNSIVTELRILKYILCYVLVLCTIYLAVKSRLIQRIKERMTTIPGDGGMTYRHDARNSQNCIELILHAEKDTMNEFE